MRVEFLANVMIFFSALFVVLSKGNIDPGSVGLSISYAIAITQELNWMVRMSSELETNMVSAERMQEYSRITEEVSFDLVNIGVVV